MSGLAEPLRELAAAHGVDTEFYDWRGNLVEVSPETLGAVLASMDVDATTPEAVARALAERRLRRWRQVLPPCVVVRQGVAGEVWAHVRHGEPVELWLELEDGGVRRLRQVDKWVDPCEVDGDLVGEATFELPADLPLGYHRALARSAGREASARVVVTPRFLGAGPRLGERRAWGFAVQLYSVRSAGSWGVGDLVDLTDLAVWSAARLGAGFVLVNPMHAAEPVAPMEPSPYLPTSRRFFNPLYLRVERVPEYADLPAADRERVAGLRRDLHDDLGGRDAVDRDAAWTAKRAALALVHSVPRSAGREVDYEAFLAREGEGLRRFAVWSALAEIHGGDFRAWPEELRDPTTAAVADFAARHADAVDFQTWLQWLTDEQLQAAQAKARAAGMPVGIVHDLAVGVHPGGADAWGLQDVYAEGAHVGAPPDPFNQLGQDWGQPPWRPARLAELGYAPFRELFAGVLRHAGGIRVDHVVGLFRLWWVPAGRPPGAGCYVRYDHEALVGIMALEASRAGAVVVGEDLGVVEPGARDYLREHGIFGTSVLWFERDWSGRPLPADRWREYCMASVGTHDLPPTAGYLAGDHVRLRHELGLLARPLEVELAADEADREAWLSEVRARGLLTPDASTEETVAALHRYLESSPARLLCVALADAVGDRRTQNQPGTVDEYPNWRVPLAGPDGRPMPLEDVMRSGRLAALVDGLGDAGHRSRTNESPSRRNRSPSLS